MADEPTTLSGSPPDTPPDTPKRAIWRRGWFLATATLVAFLIGIGAAAVLAQSPLDDEKAKTSAAQKRVSKLRSDLGQARDRVSDLKTLRDADKARAEFTAAEQAERIRLAEEAVAAGFADRIAEDNALDMDLYAYACHRYDERRS